MIRLLRPLAVAALFLLAACAQTQLGALHGPLPPAPPGTARLVFYRPLEIYDSTAWSMIYLNGVPAGESQPGAVFYRDVAPGLYHLTAQTQGYYPNQFKTVDMRAGETFYVRINTLPKSPCTATPEGAACGTADTFILTLVDPATGFREIQGLRLIPG